MIIESGSASSTLNGCQTVITQKSMCVRKHSPAIADPWQAITYFEVLGDAHGGIRLSPSVRCVHFVGAREAEGIDALRRRQLRREVVGGGRARGEPLLGAGAGGGAQRQRQPHRRAARRHLEAHRSTIRYDRAARCATARAARERARCGTPRRQPPLAPRPSPLATATASELPRQQCVDEGFIFSIAGARHPIRRRYFPSRASFAPKNSERIRTLIDYMFIQMPQKSGGTNLGGCFCFCCVCVAARRAASERGAALAPAGARAAPAHRTVSNSF